MGDHEALLQSLELYQSQLSTVESALTSATEDQYDDLIQLKKNLEEVIHLTKKSINGTESKTLLSDTSCVSSEKQETKTEDSLDEEFARFQAEMFELGGSSEQQATSSQNTANQTDNIKEITELLSQFEGSKVRAPFSQEWGQLDYHNAVVFAVEAGDFTSIDDINISVMFTNPVANAMKPCAFFLDGHCRFNVEKCRFSHGHLVKLTDLREYIEPDFGELQRDSLCLAKYKDDLWYPAVVEECLLNHKVHVKYKQYGETSIVDIHNILPLNSSADSDSSSDSESLENMAEKNSDESDEELNTPSVAWTVSSVPLGEWEKHTKGIGSKLMEKMGYVWGQGLGKQGEGRIEPVEAVVLPQGKSLDKCMELRERGLSRDMRKVHIKKKQKQKKVENQIASGYSRVQKKSVFDFLNDRILKSNKGSKVSSSKKESSDLKSLSNKGLNVESSQLADAMRKAEREVVRLEQSLERNKDRDRTMHAHVENKIAEQKGLIQQLRKRESTIKLEQENRKGHKKLTVF